MTFDPTTSPLSDADKSEAQRLITEAYNGPDTAPVQIPTSYRDHTPMPAYGTTPPVVQHGRPPMSQKATDISGVMLAGSIASVPAGGVTCLVLWTLDAVDPVNLAIGGFAPVAALLAAGTLLRRLKGIHTEHHHHYSGPVVQDHSVTTTTTTQGLLARTRNDIRS